MADITRLSRLIAGVQRGVDLAANALVVGTLKVGASKHEITEAIAAKLIKITSVANGDSGADAVSATAVGAGSAETVQGIMEELDSDIGALTHDGFGDFVAAEHIDWTGDAGASNINDANIVASNITQHVASIDHDSLLNFASAEHVDWTGDAGASNINDANIVASNITQHVASIDHDSLLNFASAEHVDWATASQGTIDVSNLPSAVLVEGDVINTLVSTSTVAPLSANQGKELKALIDGLSSGLDYAGSIDVSGGDVNMRTDGQFPTNYTKGDFYKISAGSNDLTDGTNDIAVDAGDMIIVNKDVAKASIDLSTDVDKIDNTEAADILREGDLTDGKIFVGSASNVAVGVSTSGDVSLSNAGVFAIASGVVVNDDINASAAIAYSKLNLTGAILNADINASAAIVYSKLSMSDSILNADIKSDAAIATSKLADSSELAEAVTFFGSTDMSAAEAETLTDGSNADSLHVHSAASAKVKVAGESFAANTVFAVRMAINGETDGRVYKADKDASSSIKYEVIGLVYPTGAVAAGENISVIMLGEILSSTAFTASQDEGKPVFLSSAGAVTLTPPTATDDAVFKVGTVALVGAAATAKIMVQGLSLRGVN